MTRFEVRQSEICERLDHVYYEARVRGLRVVRFYVSRREWHTLTNGSEWPHRDDLTYRGVPLRVRPAET